MTPGGWRKERIAERQTRPGTKSKNNVAGKASNIEKLKLVSVGNPRDPPG